MVRSHALCGDDDTKLRSQRGDFVSRSEQILAARRQGSSNASSLSRGASPQFHLSTGCLFENRVSPADSSPTRPGWISPCSSTRRCTRTTRTDKCCCNWSTSCDSSSSTLRMSSPLLLLNVALFVVRKQLYRFPPMSSYNRMVCLQSGMRQIRDRIAPVQSRGMPWGVDNPL